MSSLRWVFVLAVLLAWGCRSLPPGEGRGATRSPQNGGPLSERIADLERLREIERIALALRPVEDWAGSRILRQQVRVEWSGGSERFDAVLQRRPGELALVGLGPMNLVGFRLALVSGRGEGQGAGAAREAETIEFENHSGRPLPFPAAHLLADVQRVFYPWLAPGSDCDACEQSGSVGGMAVWERRAAGRVAERRFAIAGALDAGEVQVRYSDWRGEPEFPGHVELDNGWFGYRLTLETLESMRLPGP